MAEMKDFALAYAARGIKVFPAKGKHPLTEHGFHDASADPETISAWWDEYPYANIGMPTGRENGGIYVIDFDSYKDGNESFEQWVNDHGPFPDSPVAKTGRGGRHYFFIDKDEHKSATDVIPHVDIRGEGGYVIVPPSIGETGERYEWINRPLTESPISMPNKSALALLGSAPKPPQEKTNAIDLKTIPEGKRVTALISLIGRMVDMGLDPETIRLLVRKENELKCVPPLSDHDLDKQVFPALERGWIPQHSYVKATEQSFTALPEPVRLGSIWESPPALAPVLIEGVLRQGHKMIISGPSKAGKSYLLIELAYAIAEKQKWCGCQCAQGKVLYVNMEIENASFYKRVKEVYRAHGMDAGIHPDNIIVWSLRGHSAPITKLAPQIIEVAKREKCIAVIIDPLYKVLQGDENSNSDIAEMSKGFDRIAQETGCSVIYAHHFAKGYAGDKQSIDRGSGAGTFSRDPDAILTITQLDVESASDEETAWRVEYTLREFPNKSSTDLWWEYPIHKLDPKLAMYDVVTQKTAQQKIQKKIAKKQNIDIVRDVVESVKKVDDQDGFTTTDFISEYSLIDKISRNTAEKRLKDAGYYKTTEANGKPGIWHKK